MMSRGNPHQLSLRQYPLLPVQPGQYPAIILIVYNFIETKVKSDHLVIFLDDDEKVKYYGFLKGRRNSGKTLITIALLTVLTCSCSISRSTWVLRSGMIRKKKSRSVRPAREKSLRFSGLRTGSRSSMMGTSLSMPFSGRTLRY